MSSEAIWLLAFGSGTDGLMLVVALPEGPAEYSRAAYTSERSDNCCQAFYDIYADVRPKEDAAMGDNRWSHVVDFDRSRSDGTSQPTAEAEEWQSRQ